MSQPAAGREIGFRPYRKQDRQAISTILYRTGFQGEDLEGTGRFDDRTLFALVNTDAYVKYHPANVFVAFDKADGSVVGYVMGAADSTAQDRLFNRRMIWRITLRAFLVSWWKHPESFRQVILWSTLDRSMAARYYAEYPAHLHIDILPEYHRLGIGQSLMRLFEERMASQGIAGIHLITSNRNLKAMPFYRKVGYTMIEEYPDIYWRGLENQVAVVFAKHLEPSPASLGTPRNHPVVPQPRFIEYRPGRFLIDERTSIVRESGLANVSLHLESMIEGAAGRRGEARATAYSPTSQPGSSEVRLLLEPALRDALGNEGYRLSVFPDHIEMRAAESNGIFHALQTFRQLLCTAGTRCEVPCVEIEDAPRFAWRGFMLDESRFFHGRETVTLLLDLMALQKMNVFHWHLTDDQGWRMEIRRYPELTRIGSMRKGSMSHLRGRPDTISHAGFYTQEEIRQIVRYAAERFITVVPELDFPGHARSALASYPWLGCTGGPYGPYEVWEKVGIQPELLCAGRESTFEFLRAVLEEMMELFPGHWFHLGGDEAPKIRWKKCAACTGRMRSLGFHDASRLQTWMLNRMAGFLQSRGRGAIAWNDALEPELDAQVRIQYWLRHRREVAAAMRKGREVIGSSFWDCYLDHGYALTPLEKAYAYDPVLPELDEQSALRTIGLEAPLWTEMVPSRERLWYQVFPRLCAYAETAWSAASTKDWTSFSGRLPGFLRLVRSLGAAHAPLGEVSPGKVRRLFSLLSLFRRQTGTVSGRTTAAASDLTQD